MLIATYFTHCFCMFQAGGRPSLQQSYWNWVLPHLCLQRYHSDFTSFPSFDYLIDKCWWYEFQNFCRWKAHDSPGRHWGLDRHLRGPQGRRMGRRSKQGRYEGRFWSCGFHGQSLGCHDWGWVALVPAPAHCQVRSFQPWRPPTGNRLQWEVGPYLRPVQPVGRSVRHLWPHFRPPACYLPWGRPYRQLRGWPHRSLLGMLHREGEFGIILSVESRPHLMPSFNRRFTEWNSARVPMALSYRTMTQFWPLPVGTTWVSGTHPGGS